MTEIEAIEQMLENASIYGYGNFISRLQARWQEQLERSGLSKDAAMRSSWQLNPYHEDIDYLKAKIEKLEKA